MTSPSTPRLTLKRKSARQRVLAVHPRAAAFRDKYGMYEILSNKVIGHGSKEKQAW